MSKQINSRCSNAHKAHLLLPKSVLSTHKVHTIQADMIKWSMRKEIAREGVKKGIPLKGAINHTILSQIYFKMGTGMKITSLNRAGFRKISVMEVQPDKKQNQIITHIVRTEGRYTNQRSILSRLTSKTKAPYPRLNPEKFNLLRVSSGR